MVRLSDARMSGTAAGTIVVQVAPEAAAGGPLAHVRTGDVIELDVEARRLQLDVPEAELGAPPCALVTGRRRRSPAAISSSTSTTSCKPIGAPTSTSSSALRAPASFAEITKARGRA